MTSGNFLNSLIFSARFLRHLYRQNVFPAESDLLINVGLAVFWLRFYRAPSARLRGAYIDRIGRRKGLMVTLAIAAAVVRCSSPSSPATKRSGSAALALVLLLGRLLRDFLRALS